MRDFCTLSPDGFLGVEWSLSCRAHDDQYLVGSTLLDKIKADLALTLDIWAVAALADAAWKMVIVRAYSLAVLAGTSTFGWYFWIKPRVRVSLTSPD